MSDLIKRFFFWLYLILLNIEWLPVKKINYKYGELIISRLGRAIYNIKGLKLYLNPLNMIDKQLILGKDHDSTVEDLISEINWEDSYYLDIGANWGLFSLIAAKKGAKVIAFEPVTRELRLLYTHIEKNDLLKEINVFPIGLSNVKKEEAIFLGPERNSGTNSLVEFVGNQSEERIFNRLDNLLPESIAQKTKLIKIDVEGYEFFVLDGMRKIMPFFTKARFIVEITPGFLLKANTSQKDIYDFFKEFGYIPEHGIREAIQYDEIFSKNIK